MIVKITERGTKFEVGEAVEVALVPESLLNKCIVIIEDSRSFEVASPDDGEEKKRRGRPRKDDQ